MGDEISDERLDFVFKQVQSTYKNVNMEKFEAFTSSDSTLNAVYEVRRLTLGAAVPSFLSLLSAFLRNRIATRLPFVAICCLYPLLQFLDGEQLTLYFSESRGTISVKTVPPTTLKSHHLSITKAEAKPISEEMYRSEIIQGDLTTDALEHMSRVALEVYLPLLTNEKVSCQGYLPPLSALSPPP